MEVRRDATKKDKKRRHFTDPEKEVSIEFHLSKDISYYSNRICVLMTGLWKVLNNVHSFLSGKRFQGFGSHISS